MFMEGTQILDQVGGMDQDQLEMKCAKYGTPKKGEPKIIDVYCSLEELYTGELHTKIKSAQFVDQVEFLLFQVV